jgi:hypothetical protein
MVMTMRVLFSSLIVVGLAAGAAAQAPTPPPQMDQVETDPIRCWWKADRAAVRVGEHFKIVLTCGVVETGTVTVVPEVSQLEPGALQLTPFEVVSGTRRDDIVSPPWRYIQFEYVARLMTDGFFGQDVLIPRLTVAYRLQAPSGAVEGRDLGYVLPALPIRILSLVPRGTTDIRDTSNQTFADIEERRFRASVAFVAALILFASAAVLTTAGAVRAVDRLRSREAATVRPLRPAALLRGVLLALSDVRAQASAQGWNAALARRALAALRVAGAVAAGRPVAQAFVEPGAELREGQVAVRIGWVRRRCAAVSAPTTLRLLAEIDSQTGNGRARAALRELHEAMRTFSAAGYSRNGLASDKAALDAALQDAARAVGRLRARHLWPIVRPRPAVSAATTIGEAMSATAKRP